MSASDIRGRGQTDMTLPHIACAHAGYTRAIHCGYRHPPRSDNHVNQHSRIEGTRAMIESIGIVGAGTMGNGIAQICAAAGLPVVMTDINDAPLTRGMSVGS